MVEAGGRRIGPEDTAPAAAKAAMVCSPIKPVAPAISAALESSSIIKIAVIVMNIFRYDAP